MQGLGNLESNDHEAMRDTKMIVKLATPSNNGDAFGKKIVLHKFTSPH